MDGQTKAQLVSAEKQNKRAEAYKLACQFREKSLDPTMSDADRKQAKLEAGWQWTGAYQGPALPPKMKLRGVTDTPADAVSGACKERPKKVPYTNLRHHFHQRRVSVIRTVVSACHYPWK